MSRYYEKLKNYYNRGFWDEERMRNAVDKEWLTVEEFEEITNISYLHIEETPENANETFEETEEISLNDITNDIRSRYEAGEEFEDIIKDYPKLTAAEVETIKDELGISDDNG